MKTVDDHHLSILSYSIRIFINVQSTYSCVQGEGFHCWEGVFFLFFMSLEAYIQRDSDTNDGKMFPFF